MSTANVTGDGPQDVTPEPSQPLSGAERSRRYRQRQRQAAQQPRGYSWPPFTEGNTAALVHGANSSRFVDPLSAQIVAELLDSDDCPPHLHQARYSAAVAAWGRAEAMVRLIATSIAGQSVEAALTETSRGVESTEHGKGRSARRTVAKRVEGSAGALDRAERTAARMRDALGLTPASAARMRLDASPKYDSARIVAELLRADESAGQEAPDVP